MKVKVNAIPESGLTLSEPFNPMEIGLQTPGLKFTDSVQVTAHFQKERDTVLVEVSAAGNLELICGRCLEAYAQAYNGDFNFDYSVKNEFVLDVTDDIRQEILLSFPVRFLCRETCEGLCPKCGKNLNLGSCSCPR